ncbi:MAG: hypothetical protein QOJ64_2630 [Acidobacteriota bacterium]|jgi:hypothetical protein|nr:hypothetical protein [Acidobacteriota bacterium]
MHRAILAVVLAITLAPAGSASNLTSSRSALVSHKRRAHPVITLERTVCFGSCPVYKLTIYSDGRVLYQGIRFVKRIGRAEGRISRKALDALVQEFTNNEFFGLYDAYVPGSPGCPQVATDLPSAIISLELNGKKKTVRHYHGCAGLSALKVLTELEAHIDAAVNSKKWIK